MGWRVSRNAISIEASSRSDFASFDTNGGAGCGGILIGRRNYVGIETSIRRRENMNSETETVVITGASAGLGRAIAQAFAKRGARIGLLARGLDGLDGARRDVEELGGDAIICQTDVSDSAAVERAAEKV